MRRPKLKSGSKRMTCRKRFKIQKKVKEHNRKLRKDAKKKGGPKRVKKDPGIPNDAPFKEEVLRDAALRKQRLEELKQQQKLDRQKEQAKKRKEKANKKEPTAKKQPEKVDSAAKKPSKSSQIHDKHSPATFCRELRKVIKEADVVLEVLDARDPLSSRCPQVEQAVLHASGNKKLVLILNKIDLVPKEILGKWLESLKDELPTVAFKCATQLQDRSTEVRRKMKEGCVEVSRGNTCLGSETLMPLLHGYCTTPEQTLKVGVVGFANVGKSSLINSLKQMRACNAGPLRGTTKCMQGVDLDQQIKLLDSPGIIASPSNSAVALCIRSASDAAASDLASAVNTVLKHCSKQQVMLQYSIPDFRNSPEFLILLAQKRGMLAKGGLPDTECAARLLLSDWIGAKLSYHCHPPAVLTLQPHLQEATIKMNKQGVDMKELEEKNKDTVKAVKCSNLAGSIVFQSPGLTNGILDENEMTLTEQATDPEEEMTRESEELEAGQDGPCEVDPTEKNPKQGTEDTGLSRSGPADLMTTKRKSQAKASDLKPQQAADTLLGNEPLGLTVNLDRSAEPEDAYDFNIDYA
ncbi:guanine nucleotide-binding protein-like 3 [Ambystoma mexicanum]|uniref:guanine nucleotide-binding protein-like 3 n=1 Tax=Ambystoma mexicanum TaxID=8296 RepID=UPI0037E7C2E0